MSFKSLLFLLMPLIYAGCNQPCIPVEIKDIHESLKPGGTNRFFYAFAKGDSISIKVEVTEGTLSAFTITDYPNNVKFSIKDFNEKIEKRIAVDATNCFAFDLRSDKGCKFNYTIIRIPGANTPPNYCSKVCWKNNGPERDSIEFVNLTEEPEFISLCSGSGKYNPFNGCKTDRIIRNYELPEGTTYWIYRLDVDNSKIDQKIAQHDNLFSQICSSRFPSEAKIAGEVLMYLNQPPSTGYACDLFFFNKADAGNRFEKLHKDDFYYDAELSKLNTQGVCQRVKGASNNHICVGFRNNHNLEELKVAFQVTAAVLKKVKTEVPDFQMF